MCSVMIHSGKNSTRNLRSLGVGHEVKHDYVVEVIHKQKTYDLTVGSSQPGTTILGSFSHPANAGLRGATRALLGVAIRRCRTFWKNAFENSTLLRVTILRTFAFENFAPTRTDDTLVDLRQRP